METKTHISLNTAILKLMRPLVRILLRNGVSFQQFSNLARWVFVDVAGKEFGIEGKRQTDSRVSVITGLSRKDVRKMKDMKPLNDHSEIHSYNRAAKVISGWRKDPDFIDAKGKPKVLHFESGCNNFSQLVKRYSGDATPRAILDEFKRVGCIRIKNNREIMLTADGYVPAGDKPAILSILGTDVSDLINTIDNNLTSQRNGLFFQRKVAYDNLPNQVVEKFRKLGARESQKLLDRMDRWLSKHDRDTQPDVKGTGRKRSGFGIYYFENEL